MTTMPELNQISDREKITGNFHFVRRPRAALRVSLPCAPNPEGQRGVFSISLSSHPSFVNLSLSVSLPNYIL